MSNNSLAILGFKETVNLFAEISSDIEYDTFEWNKQDLETIIKGCKVLVKYIPLTNQELINNCKVIQGHLLLRFFRFCDRVGYVSKDTSQEFILELLNMANMYKEAHILFSKIFSENTIDYINRYYYRALKELVSCSCNIPMENGANEYLALYDISFPCSLSELKNKRKQLAKQYHPDICDENVDVMQKINIAFEYLEKFTY